jgi:hypothetical protein
VPQCRGPLQNVCQLFGNDDPRTAEVLLRLGGWQGLRSDQVEGEKLLEEARAINARQFGVESREHLQPMLALALVHARTGSKSKLLTLVPQIMTIMKTQPGLQDLEHAANLLIQGRARCCCWGSRPTATARRENALRKPSPWPSPCWENRVSCSWKAARSLPTTSFTT